MVQGIGATPPATVHGSNKKNKSLHQKKASNGAFLVHWIANGVRSHGNRRRCHSESVTPSQPHCGKSPSHTGTRKRFLSNDRPESGRKPLGLALVSNQIHVQPIDSYEMETWRRDCFSKTTRNCTDIGNCTLSL